MKVDNEMIRYTLKKNIFDITTTYIVLCHFCIANDEGIENEMNCLSIK